MSPPTISAADPAPGRSGWLFVAAACWAMMSISFINAGHAVLMPRIMDSFSWSDAQGGLFLGAMFWGMTVAVLATGPIVDAIGYRAPFTVGVLMQFAGALTISCSGGLASAVTGALLANLGSGAILGVATPAGCDVFSRHRTAVCGALIAAASTGTVVAGAIIVLLIDSTLSWRGVSGLLAAMTVLAVVGGFFAPARRAASPERPKGKYPLHLLRHPAYLAVLTAMFVISTAAMAAGMWIPDYVSSMPGAGIRTGAIGIMAHAAGWAVGSSVTGVLVKLLGQRRLMVVGCAAASALLLVGSTTANSPILAIIVFGLFGVAVSLVSPTLLGHAGDRFPAEGASMFALINSAGNFGGVAGPLLFGVAADAIGQVRTLRLTAALPLIALGVVVAVVHGRRSPVDVAAASVKDD